ncbi:hypothetical protein [Kitasatospora sp. NPDC096140]|uniref:hypothetical protein n=1 Tax=Kitasatospora sp. NPDC096140 TaxID=3155425 RepID=UPI00332A116D
MEQLTEDDLNRLNDFLCARLHDAAALPASEADRIGQALSVTLRSAYTEALRGVRMKRTSLGYVPQRARTAQAWDLMVGAAIVWQNHSDFPADLAVRAVRFHLRPR